MLIKRLRWLSIASLALIGAGLVLYAGGLPQHASYTGRLDAKYGYVAPEIGERAPPFQATLLDGSTIYLYDFISRPVIINFWATWCIPCEIEMPVLETIAETYPDIVMLAINIGEDPGTIRQWLSQLNITLPVVLDTDLSIAEQYRLRGQPTTFVIAPDGYIHKIYFGIVQENELNMIIKDLLN